MGDTELKTKESIEGLQELYPDSHAGTDLASPSGKISIIREYKMRCRFFRKRISAFIRQRFQRRFTQILYVTSGEIPVSFIQNLRNQYPDKEIRVITPIFGNPKGLIKTHVGFKFFLQNTTYEAQIYKFPKNNNNICVYGVYSDTFSDIEKNDFFNIKYLSPYIKCVRLFGKKLRPDIIHSDKIPFFMGSEFETKLKYPIKVIQTVDDFNSPYFRYEPFWALINIADKAGMKKICKDKIVQKCIAVLFNQRSVENFNHMKECLDFIYQNYIRFRNEIEKDEQIAENTIFERLNARILKLFPQIFQADIKTYRPLLTSAQKSDFWAVLSESYYQELFDKDNNTLTESFKNTKENSGYLLKTYDHKNSKINRSFNADNFRDMRYKNKQFMLKEFSKDRIRLKFTDNVFFKQECIIRGYLDSFYDAPVLIGIFKPQIHSEAINITISTILKLFEQNKNIQFIFNIQDGLKNSYIKSFVEFCENSPALNGRWLFLDGEINLPQFFSSTDIAMMPFTTNTEDELLNEAIKYGCVPVISRTGIYNDTMNDIFDDMNTGCGFKTDASLNIIENPDIAYLKTVTKALNFYIQNGSWNLMIKNCLNHSSEWDFQTLEKYNQIYDELL